MHIVDFTFRSLISSVLAASKAVMGSVYFSGEQDGVENRNYSMQFRVAVELTTAPGGQQGWFEWI